MSDGINRYKPITEYRWLDKLTGKLIPIAFESENDARVWYLDDEVETRGRVLRLIVTRVSYVSFVVRNLE